MFKSIEFFKGKSRDKRYELLRVARNDVCSAGRCTSRKDGCFAGRSMIEMLGVLAIVGVLSVGGIAGYSKAMEKFKVNKTIDEVLTIVSNTRILYANTKDQDFYRELNGSNYAFMRDFIFPKETDTGTRHGFVHALGGVLDADFGYGYNKGIMVSLYGLSREACITLATNDWGGDSSGFVGIEVGRSLYSSMIECSERSEELVRDFVDNMGVVMACRPFNVNTLPLPPALAAKGCDCIDKRCNIELLFEE